MLTGPIRTASPRAKRWHRIAGVLPILLLLSGYSGDASALDGSFDTTWAGGGSVVFPGDPLSSTNSTGVSQIVLTGSGRLLLGGFDSNFVGPGIETWFVGELQAAGTPVLTFGASNGSGMVSGCYLSSALCQLSGGGAFFMGMALQADGRIGVANTNLLTRLNATASALDTTGVAGGNGYVPIESIQINDVKGTFSSPSSMLPISSGKWLVAGYGYYSQVATLFDFAVIRLNSDLSLDTSFNAQTDSNNVTFAGGQLVAFNPGSGEVDSAANQVLVQSDGRILLTGSVHVASGQAIGIARLNADGTPDLTYGGGTGKVILTWSGGSVAPPGSRAAKLDIDDRLLLATGATPTATTIGQMAVVRVSTGGTLDSNFGSNGVSHGISPLCTYGGGASALAFDSAGRIVAGGYCVISETAMEFLLTRVRGDNGALDTGFGINGFSHGNYSATSLSDSADDIVVDSTGRPVFGGTSYDGSINSAAVGRVTYDLIRMNGFESAPRGCLPPDCN